MTCVCGHTADRHGGYGTMCLLPGCSCCDFVATRTPKEIKEVLDWADALPADCNLAMISKDDLRLLVAELRRLAEAIVDIHVEVFNADIEQHMQAHDAALYVLHGHGLMDHCALCGNKTED